MTARISKTPAQYKALDQLSKNSILQSGNIKITVYISKQNMDYIMKQSKKLEHTYSKIVNNLITEARKDTNAGK